MKTLHKVQLLYLLIMRRMTNKWNIFWMKILDISLKNVLF
jgi:hypothetical protein